MVITIGEKDYELHFGWDFIETLNKLNGVVVEGMNMDTGGVTKLVGQLDLGDPIAARLAITAGTSTYANKPSKKAIGEYVVKLIEEDGFDDFLEQLHEKLETSPLTRVTLQRESKAL